VLFGEIPERLAAETDHLQRIRTYLGWRPFDDEARERLTRWLTPRATDDVLPYDLMARAEDILQTWQVILPASSTLEELIASVTARVQGALYPLYFGYYDQALTVYTHLADQHCVFHTQVIACSVHEAIHVLDGLLANDTILRPKGHFVDQHGYTDQLFGLCHLLGYSLRPRLNVSKQTLYKLDRGTSYGHLDAVFAGAIEVALIREQWDQLVRVAASLRNRTAPAHIVLTCFASSAPSDRLSQGAHGLGTGAQDPLPLALYPRGTAPRANATPDQPG
jgi:TnpA family transposase